MTASQGPPYLGHLEHDDTAVELLHRGASVLHRSLRGSRLVQAATNIASSLVDRTGFTVSPEGVGGEPGEGRDGSMTWCRWRKVIRLEYGAQLPGAGLRESHKARERRREKTKYALEQDVMAQVNKARVTAGRPVLSIDQEDHVVELVLSVMFLLPHLFGILEREPLAEDLVVLFGSPEVRVDLANGEVVLYPPIARTDAEWSG